MALEKHIWSVHGVNTTYWKATDVSLNSMNGTAHIVVSGFLDQNTRNNGFLPLKTLEYDVSAEIVQAYFPSSLDIAQIYAYLKLLPDFDGAVDC